MNTISLTDAVTKYKESRAELEREAEDFGATGSAIYDNRVQARNDLDEAVRDIARAAVGRTRIIQERRMSKAQREIVLAELDQLLMWWQSI